MREPLRIMFIATDLSTGGGVNKVIRDLAVLFKQRLGANVTVVNARSDRPSTYAFPADVPLQQHRRQSLLAYFRLLVRLRRSRPDVVISSWTQDNILVTLAFLFSRTKVVLAEHSSWHFHGRAIRLLRRITYPLASQVVVLNRRDLNHYRRYLRNVRLIPDSVTGEPPSGGTREKLIIAVGHLEPLKNFDDAIRAMAMSRLEDEGWSLAIIGSGSREGELRKLIDELGLTRTQIHPPVDHLRPWYDRASILLVTSRLESFSLVLAEAMLSGVVPLAYVSDGPSFILEDFREQLVAIGDVPALAERLVHFAKASGSDRLRQQLSASIHERFSPDVIVEQWKALLEPPPCH
jgi:glycosyltransferase involved in cell wall biosynthesis